MYENITLEEAMALVMELCPPLPAQEVETAQATGRPLVEPAAARRDLPPFDCSRIDGYAVRAADLHRANHKRPALLQVMDAVFAGQTAAVPVGPGQAVRLEQGAPLPAGCDCVVPLCDTDGGEEQVSVFCQLWPFDNIQHQGGLAQAGQPLCQAGQTPDSGLTALLRSAGVQTVFVRPTPRLGVLTIGNQLSSAEADVLPPACVPDFNLLYLTECWRETVDGVLGQSRKEKADEIMLGCKQLLPTGISLLLIAGGRDLVREGLLTLGAEPVFRGIKLRGQGATAAYRYRQVLILHLPGEPFAAGTAARILVPPALGSLEENPALLPRRKKVTLLSEVAQSRPDRRLLPARLEEHGALLLDPEGENAAALCGMTALVDIPGGSKPLLGSVVTALVFP